jgi:ADP-ribose pyrophosphatase
MSYPFTVTSHTVLYEGRVFTIERDDVRHVTGYAAVREVVRHAGGAVVVPLYDNLDVLLIRQYRYPVDGEIIELPAGKLDADENPRDCAVRELREETGCTASSVTKLTAMMTTPGFCSELLHIFLARGLRDGAQQLEEGEESIALLRVPLADAVEMCRDGRISDGKTVTGLMLAALEVGLLHAADAKA